jgi:CRP-like cAMP-binding protein
MSDLQVIIQKLSSSEALSHNERAAILALPHEKRDTDANEQLVQEGATPSTAMVVLRGMVFRHKSGPASRQVLSLHPPGDLPDIQSLFLKHLDHGISVAAEPSRVALVPHSALIALFDTHRRLERVFWRETLIEASLYRESLTSMGTRPALQRAAHYFCEHFTRMKTRDLADESSCDMPLTQFHLAEALGVSLVSVNRCIRVLRERGLADHREGLLRVLNWTGLAALAEFDDSYLFI